MPAGCIPRDAPRGLWISMTDWAKQLVDNTLLRSVEHLPEAASTNDRALERLGKGDLHPPALIVADRQTAGRGRGANTWWAGDGALTFSIVVENAETDARVALWTGIAVVRALEAMYPANRFQLKWPNDIWLNRKKLGGILIELPPNRPDIAVIGIGLNVNNSLRDAPEEIRDFATSLVDATGVETNRYDCLHRTVDTFDSTLADRNDADLVRIWSNYCGLTNHTVTLHIDDEPVAGVCRGIQADGALLIETADGIRAAYSANQVRVNE